MNTTFNDQAIIVSKVSKSFRIYRKPADRLKEIILRKPFHSSFTALSDISFTVPRGETFGIIGENGAGKSTLLKILAKTLKPTSGECIVNGRSAALLELGTGFNPEMTGEENIYLTAYLMGLTKPEIDARKQGIIDFSELNDFIGRPVKTYSSGMHVRLAFSIATSVNPDVLIIDEALSVGDEYFQKKCIDRMVSFKDAGKTIVFCSHSMYHIQELCSRVAWIHKGLIRNLGSTGKVVIDYQNFERAKSAAVREKAAEEIVATAETTEKTMQVIDIKVLGKEGNEIETIRPLDPITISFRILCRSDDITGHIGFGIIRNDEVTVFGTMSHYDGLPPIRFRNGQEFKVNIKSLPLLPGIYSLGVFAADESALHPFDLQRTRNIYVTHGRKEFGMTHIEHEWVIGV